LNEARLAKVRGQLAKLQEFWNKRTAMLMQQNELAAHSMQLYNTAQYPAAGYGEQYQQYQPAQPVQQYQPALPVQQSQPAYYLQVLGEVKTENTETPSTYQDPGQHYAVQPGPSQPQGHCGPSQASCDPGFILPDQMTPPPSDCSPMQSESHSPAEPGHEHAVKTEIPTPERLPPAQDASPGFSKSLLDSDLLTLSQDQLLDMLLNDNTSPAAAPVAGLSMPDLGDEQLHPEPVGNSAGADDSAAGPSSTSHLWDELLSIING
jgi:hypothetical protein